MDNLYISLESSKTFKSSRSHGMVIGVHLPIKDQAILDSVVSAKAILLIPWTEEEGKSWMSTWNPTVLGKSTWQVPQVTLNYEVEGELLALTRLINLSTGLGNPSDKRVAQETFARLKAKGHRPNPEDVRKWAMRHNWSPKFAEDLKKLATRYFTK